MPLLFVVPAPAAFGESGFLAQFDPEIAWAEKEILAGDYGRARKRMVSTAEEFMDRIGPGEGGELLLGMLALHRALAEAGLGNEADAHWYYRVALAFNPLLEDFGLDRFGEPGRFLLESSAAIVETAGDDAEAGDRSRATSVFNPAVTPPKKKRSPKPEFPFGAKYFGMTGVLIVQVIISDDGRPTNPHVLKALPAATLTWAALEAVRTWRFEPARLNGKPVPVFYNLTVNYKLRK